MEPYSSSWSKLAADAPEKLLMRGSPAWVPDELVELLDFSDPDVAYVCSAARHLRAAGLDITDPAVFRQAVDLGHKRAAGVADDAEMRSRVERELNEQELALAAAYRSPAIILKYRVYYMLLGGLCKIGYTTNLRERAKAINPQEILATEPGGYDLEQQRHDEFQHLRVHGEWFRYEGALVEHIRKLREARKL